jgi:1-deoxy-D-xylulose-5-phosphate synthase
MPHPYLLQSIQRPADLRELPESKLPQVAEELRQYLIDIVSGSGGHLASGLGTVELTIALHYVFNTPKDALVWDVGHQCYPHKILTGRREQLASIRKRGGLSGFLKRDESPFDHFGAGHSSTSISAALGMALANRQLGLAHKSVAIIGDGALTAGLAFEALDHAGATDADLLIVLNDNRMSISPNVGALNDYLGALVAEGSRGRWFEDLKLHYGGPVDGHDLKALVAELRRMHGHPGPRLLHVVTQKGRGYARAEQEPIKYHGVTPFDPAAGLHATAAPALPTYTQVFGDWLCEAAEKDPRICVITPAMREGSGLVKFAARFPDRYHDVGIAEQHCVTLAAGLAAQGLRPVVAIYSTFLQRAYDQLIHDVVLQKLPVVFAIDRAGLVGPDGATHNGALDLSFLRCVPDMTVMAPANGTELRDMLHTGIALGAPAAVRYPRTTIPTALTDAPPSVLPLGTAKIEARGREIAILAFGTLLDRALEVGRTLGATVVNMRFVKPLDEQCLLELGRSHRLLVTLEENAVAGGAGSAVAECLHARQCTVPVLTLGLPDRFIEHGTRDEALADAGLHLEAILQMIGERHPMRLPTAQGTSIARATLGVVQAAGRLLATFGPAAPGRRLALPDTPTQTH